MKILTRYLVVLSCLILVQCSQNNNGESLKGDRLKVADTKHINLPSYLLKQQWVRSFEEDDALGGMVFRPSYYKEFPPARFRQVVVFNSNRTCDILLLNANDAHAFKQAKWRFLNSEVIEIYETISTKKDNVLHRWSVVKSEKDLLVVKE